MINTHFHSDHSGGLRTYVAEGSTVVMAEAYKAYFETLFKAPHTVIPDTLSAKPTDAKIETAGATPFIIKDAGARTVEVRLVAKSTHSEMNLAVYIPDAKLLFTSDLYNPGFSAPDKPLTGFFAPFAQELYAWVVDQKLDIAIIAGGHGLGTATLANLKVHAGG